MEQQRIDYCVMLLLLLLLLLRLLLPLLLTQAQASNGGGAVLELVKDSPADNAVDDGPPAQRATIIENTSTTITNEELSNITKGSNIHDQSWQIDRS